MAIASLPTPTRLPLVRSLFPAPGPAPAEGHLHFDREARVWRSHDERAARSLTQPALQECA